MRKMSNRELAHRTGYSEAHISRVLRGKVSPSLDCITILARVLEISVDQMVAIIRHPEK